MSANAEVPLVACSVSWCIQPSTAGMVLFDLPLDDQEKQKWMDNLSVSPPVPRKFFVCSSHFSDEAFVIGSSYRTLKSNALPSRNYFVRPANVDPPPVTIKTEPETDPSKEMICRACMVDCRNSHKSLLVAENLSMFETSTGVVLTKSERLPDSICCKCFDTITNWQSFKKQCQSSNDLFSKRLSEETTSVALIDFTSIKRKINTLMSSNKRKKMAPNESKSMESNGAAVSDKNNLNELSASASTCKSDSTAEHNEVPLHQRCQIEFNNGVISSLNHIQQEQIAMKRDLSTKLDRMRTQYVDLNNYLMDEYSRRENHILAELATIYAQLDCVCKKLDIRKPIRRQRVRDLRRMQIPGPSRSYSTTIDEENDSNETENDVTVIEEGDV